MPVIVATVEEKDTPVTVNSIGRVLPLATVTVKPQVGGKIAEVHFEEGQQVKKDDLLFVIDKRPSEIALQQAQAMLEQARASAANAGRQSSRYNSLNRAGSVAKEEVDQIRTAEQTAQAAVKNAEAAVEAAQLQLDYCDVRSPQTGRTGKRLADPGNVVTANTTELVVINQIDPIQVSFTIPERFLSALKQNVSAGMVARATPEGAHGIEGKVIFLDNAVAPASGTIELKAVFDNADAVLWPGQFVQVELILSMEKNAILTPARALQNGQLGQFVFVVKGDGSAEVRKVELDRVVGELAVIRSGLIKGERVVIDGQSRLTPGARMEIKTGLADGKEAVAAKRPDQGGKL